MVGRRGNSEGNIRKRGDGRWEVRVSLPNGGRKSYYGKTRQEVQQLLRQAQRDLDGGLPVITGKQTFAQYLESWYKSVELQLKQSTRVRYRTQLRCHILPSLGDIPLTRLTQQQLQEFYNAKLKSGLSISTVQNMHTVIHSSLKEAVRLDLVQRNVADLVRIPARRHSPKETLTEDQIQTFLSAIKGNRLEALYILALTTGMREGELLGLQWSDIDFESSALSIIHSTSILEKGRRFYLTEPKTSTSRRRIALSKLALEALQAHRRQQENERKGRGELWDYTYDLVFPNTLGRIIDRSHFLHREFYPVLKMAGLPMIHFHNLRHTAATLMLRRGVNPKIVSEILGHAHISITLDIYSHVTPDMQQGVAQMMDDMLRSRNSGKGD